MSSGRRLRSPRVCRPLALGHVRAVTAVSIWGSCLDRPDLCRAWQPRVSEPT